MPTKNPRVNVTMSQKLFEYLGRAGKKRQKSRSEVVRQALLFWIEHLEDEKLYWILKKIENEPTISHEEFWEKVEKREKED